MLGKLVATPGLGASLNTYHESYTYKKWRDKGKFQTPALKNMLTKRKKGEDRGCHISSQNLIYMMPLQLYVLT